MLSPAGQRLRQTFRKLPKASPSSPAKTVPKMRIMREVEYTAGCPTLAAFLFLRLGWEILNLNLLCSSEVGRTVD